MSKKIKILAIDDEIRAVELLKLSLEEYGFEVITASNGQSGLYRAIEDKPDIIILDIRMPELDGWDVCKSLKSNESTKHIPVIFLTAFSNTRRDMERAESLNVSAYITKPVDPIKLVSLIGKLICNIPNIK